MYVRDSLIALLLLTALTVPGCGWLAQNAGTIRKIAEIALDLCATHMSANPEALDGASVGEYCEVADNMLPFTAAAEHAGGAMGLPNKPE